MSGVDLNIYSFDYDLTWAALLMNADGKIYHTYAGRDWTDADSHHDLDALARLLRSTLREHQIHQRRGRHPKRAPPKTVEDFPPLARRIQQGGRPDCIHCHTVHDVMTQDLKERGEWTADHRWRWPDPIQLGLRLESVDSLRVRDVQADSVAHTAGLQVGDQLDRVDQQRVRSFGDIQRVLNKIPNRGADPLEIEWFRGSKALSATVQLTDGWREASPRVYAWRASKWPLSPKPGFGGPALGAEEKRQLGLNPQHFAFRVDYLVTWGEASHTGRNAAQAGIRKGDVIYSIDGKTDLESIEHFHAWFRLTRQIGTSARIELLREGKKHRVDLPVVE